MEKHSENKVSHKNSKPALLSCYKEGRLEAGIDEAGRGCLAGPVFASAVILKPGFYHPLLNDSKKLSASQRQELKKIIEKEAGFFAVAAVDNKIIDQINIVQASVRAMHDALSGLKAMPEFLLIDGNYFTPYKNVPHQCIIKGDGKYAAIAAASVLAKTWRDDYMNRIHKIHPEYGWNKNKGYATRSHREAIQRCGLTPFHRKSFRLTDGQLEIPFVT